jgi:hydroxylamine reductase
MENALESTMFCYQCQDASNRAGCVLSGICGKSAGTADLQDLLIYVTKGLASVVTALRDQGTVPEPESGRLIEENLALTTAYCWYDAAPLVDRIRKTLEEKRRLMRRLDSVGMLPEAARWDDDPAVFMEKAQGKEVRVMDPKDPDRSSLRQLILSGLRGIAELVCLSRSLGEENDEIDEFLQRSLAMLIDDAKSAEDLLELSVRTGRVVMDAAAFLDDAKRFAYQDPELTPVDVGTGDRPAILVAGNDFRDLERILEQTMGKDVDVYTAGDLLAAHAYPLLRGYDQLAGNYGNAWNYQQGEFLRFGGAVLLTGSRMLEPDESLKDRVFTTGITRYPDVPYIEEDEDGEKDFSPVIEKALSLDPPEEMEHGKLLTGFGHEELFRIAPSVAAAIESGEIKKIVVILGGEGTDESRFWYTGFALALPEDTLILTAGEIKYRLNKQNFGQIAGLPRLIDCGCGSDWYSILLFLMRLSKLMGKESVNDLPVRFELSWFDSQDIACLLALFSLGIRGVRIGPSVPAFFSGSLTDLFAETFDLAETLPAEDEVRFLCGEDTEINEAFELWKEAVSAGPVSGDMLVSELIRQYPEAADVLAECGMPCAGCFAAQSESVAQACRVHGLDVKDVLSKLNQRLQ